MLEAVIQALLPIINRIHATVLGVRPLAKNSIMSVEVGRHKGCPIRLPDGCEVKPGDRVIKLHLNNTWIAEKLRSASRSGKMDFPRNFGRHFQEGLQALATEVASGKYGSIVAIYGWTAFHTHARRCGFMVIDLPNTLRTRLARLHVAALMDEHRVPWLAKRFPSRRYMDIKAIWLSRGELLRIYGTAS